MRAETHTPLCGDSIARRNSTTLPMTHQEMLGLFDNLQVGVLFITVLYILQLHAR